MVKTFITQIDSWRAILTWPRIEAESPEECNKILMKEYKWHITLVWELLEEWVDEDTGDSILLIRRFIK